MIFQLIDVVFYCKVLLDISPLEFSKVVNSRLWLEKADWTSWTNTLEDLSKDILEIEDCNEIWSRIKQSINEASDKFIPTIKSCHHSKPFWNADLSAARKEVRKCRKHFRLKSNYSNGLALDTAKKQFKTSLALEASNWMQILLQEFGYKRRKDFWKTYNRLYKKNPGIIGPIRTSSDQRACKKSEIAHEFRKIFFESKHLSTQNCDEDHHENVKREHSVNSN